jgi:hypothetical protein
MVPGHLVVSADRFTVKHHVVILSGLELAIAETELAPDRTELLGVTQDAEIAAQARPGSISACSTTVTTVAVAARDGCLNLIPPLFSSPREVHSESLHAWISKQGYHSGCLNK